MVVNNTSLAQQLASGKAQLATIGGHQVVIRSTPTGNQIVHLNSTNSGLILKSNVTATTTPSKNVIQPATTTQQGVQSLVTTATTTMTSTTSTVPASTANAGNQTTETSSNTVTTSATSATTQTTTTSQMPAAPAPGSVEASLLAGQPPGTVIKCVTAQVIQTTQGPRIVLQGLQGNDFTPQQLAMVQQQVKQQLLKGKTESFASNCVKNFFRNVKTISNFLG